MNEHPLEKSAVRILVVDDSMLMRLLIQETLADAGFEVLTAVDGLEAWGMLQKERFRLLVADVNMPHMDGLELTRRIRADGQLGDLPIILISATDTELNKRRGLMCGADAFVMKDRRDIKTLPDRITQLLLDG